MISFYDVLITVVFLVLLAVPGYLFAKLKMFPEKAAEAFSTLVLYGCQPILILVSFQSKEYQTGLGLNMLYVAVIATFAHLLMFAILKLLFIKRSADDKIRVVKYASVFANCGFMGLPFLKSLLAGNPQLDEAMIYGAVIIAVFNVINWTVGVYVMTGDKSQISAKKILLNPVIISVVIGLLAFFILKKPITKLAEGTALSQIADKFMQSLNFISDMVTPLSLIVVGIKLANVNFKSLFMDKWAYVASALKLAFMPIVCLLTVAFLPIDHVIKWTIVLLLSMPCATGTTMFAVKFGKDGNFASVCVLLSVALSVLSVPLLYLLGSAVMGGL